MYVECRNADSQSCDRMDTMNLPFFLNGRSNMTWQKEYENDFMRDLIEGQAMTTTP